MSGLKLAAVYGIRPHELGFCGPKEAKDQQILRKFIQGKFPAKKIKPILKKFKGAYPYYQLIAKSNGIKDPFDKKVVSAYWLGNELLDRVKNPKLQKMIINKFSGHGLLDKKDAIKKAKAIPQNSKPHHSFHVLAIGSVTNVINFNNTKLKDICRIGWGKVVKEIEVRDAKKKKAKVIVEYQPLVGGKKIKLGKMVKKEIFYDKDLVPKIKKGDLVSFHWNCLVQVLNKKEMANLKKYTLNTVNSLLV